MPSTQRKRRAMPLLTCQEKQWPSMCDWVCKVCKVCMVCMVCMVNGVCQACEGERACRALFSQTTLAMDLLKNKKN